MRFKPYNGSVLIGVLAIRVNLPGNRSLKEKRRVIRSAISRTQTKFKLTTVEVGDQEHHDTALLGVAYISTEVSHIDSVFDNVLNFISGTSLESEFYPEYREILRV